MGELYVSEILKHRSDLESPTQLMKELLLGKLNSGNNMFNSNTIVSAMMSQALKENDDQNFDQDTPEAELLNCFLTNNTKQTPSFEPIDPPSGTNIDQNMVDASDKALQEAIKNVSIHQTQNVEAIDPQLMEVDDNAESKASLKKRDRKADVKEEEKKFDDSNLDTQNRINERSESEISKMMAKIHHQTQKLEKKPSPKKPEGRKRVKRAPKKSNQRVFLPKISKQDKSCEEEANQGPVEESVDDFCKKLIESTIANII